MISKNDRCSVCDETLSDWYFEKGDILFCQMHYWAKYGQSCQQCCSVRHLCCHASKAKTYLMWCLVDNGGTCHGCGGPQIPPRVLSMFVLSLLYRRWWFVRSCREIQTLLVKLSDARKNINSFLISIITLSIQWLLLQKTDATTKSKGDRWSQYQKTSLDPAVGSGSRTRRTVS